MNIGFLKYKPKHGASRVVEPLTGFGLTMAGSVDQCKWSVEFMKIYKGNYATINSYLVHADNGTAFSRIGTKRSACERAGIDFQQVRVLDYMVYGWLGGKWIAVTLRDYKSARQLFDAMAAQPATEES